MFVAGTIEDKDREGHSTGEISPMDAFVAEVFNEFVVIVDVAALAEESSDHVESIVVSS